MKKTLRWINYFPGIATHDSNWWRRLVCATTGDGLIEKVREAYATIAAHWQPGDEIYLFGFSRGAYTVRTVGALIAEFGLLSHKPNGIENFYQLLAAYQLKNDRESQIELKAGNPPEKWAWLNEKPVPIKCPGVF